MDEKRPQPAWKTNGQQQPQQQRDSRDHRSWNRGQRRDNRDRDRSRRQDAPASERRAPVVGPLEVEVYGNDVAQALRVLKTKVSKDGLLAELRRHKHAEKPSEAKRRKHHEALKRMRKSKGKSRGGWGRRDRSKVVASRPLPDSAAIEIPIHDESRKPSDGE
jgi:ribosomal protein S21